MSEAPIWPRSYELATLERPRHVSFDTLVRTYMLHKMILWTDRIHEYEDAGPPATDA